MSGTISQFQTVLSRTQMSGTQMSMHPFYRFRDFRRPNHSYRDFWRPLYRIQVWSETYLGDFDECALEIVLRR